MKNFPAPVVGLNYHSREVVLNHIYYLTIVTRHASLVLKTGAVVA